MQDLKLPKTSYNGARLKSVALHERTIMTKQQIRRDVFETNSSSSHSLVLGKEQAIGATLPKNVLRAGTAAICVGEYGWEWMRYYTVINKARYLLTHITDGEVSGGTAENCRKYPKAAWLVDIFKETFEVTLEFEESSGHIDHESIGCAEDVLSSKDAMRAFLLDETAYVETGNDNSTAPWLIATDKGDKEHSFKEFFAEVPESGVDLDFRSITLKLPKELDAPLGTKLLALGPTLVEAGSFMETGEGRELIAAVFSAGVVMKLHGTETVPSRLGHYEKSEGEVLLSLVRLTAVDGPPPPVRIANKMEPTCSAVVKEGYDMSVEGTIRVPQSVAERVAGYPGTTESQVLLSLAKRVSQWLAERPNKGNANKLEKLAAYIKALEKKQGSTKTKAK